MMKKKQLKITDMNDYELHIPPVRFGKSPVNGRFMKGHVPANKGKTWDEYMPKRSQKRAAKGWKNLYAHRPKTRPDNAGRCRKPVIAVMDDGRWCYFTHIGAAAEWLGGLRENVRRCCHLNRSEKILNDHKGRPTGKVNTDHKYKGVRFYFEQDARIWTKKIKN